MNGHLWTIAGHVTKGLRPAALAPSRFWATRIPDERFGQVRLSGRLALSANSSTLVLVVHGLGGSSQSPYMFEAAAAAARFGYSSLRLDLRGADRRGEDLFHAGLGADLEFVLASPEIRNFKHVLLFGYSLGGHVCLSYAASGPHARVKAVAAICSPLDLAASAKAFDAPALFSYRRHVLTSLVEMYRQMSVRRDGLCVSILEAENIRQIQDWDERVVAPHHGFSSKEQYYERASVASRLSAIELPTLLLSATSDPMVPKSAVSHCWNQLPANIRVVEKSRGGHISFPASFSLGQSAASGMESQVIRWLASSAGL